MLDEVSDFSSFFFLLVDVRLEVDKVLVVSYF